jgi:hypothetical protein
VAFTKRYRAQCSRWQSQINAANNKKIEHTMMLALSLGRTQAYVIKKRGGEEDVGKVKG